MQLLGMTVEVTQLTMQMLSSASATSEETTERLREGVRESSLEGEAYPMTCSTRTFFKYFAPGKIFPLLFSIFSQFQTVKSKEQPHVVRCGLPRLPSQCDSTVNPSLAAKPLALHAYKSTGVERG